MKAALKAAVKTLLAVVAVVVFRFKRKIVITADATNDRSNGFICNGLELRSGSGIDRYVSTFFLSVRRALALEESNRSRACCEL